MNASDIVDRVEADLLDTGNDRWSENEHFENMRSAERQIVFFKPSAYVTADTFQLDEGIRQTLPDGAIELVRVTRNMGLDGNTPGAAITPVSPKDMDELVPDWRSATADDEVLHYIFRDQDRYSFDVYPPQPSSNQGYVEALFSMVPPPLSLGDEYIEPLIEYMMYAAYKRNAGSSAFDVQRAVAHYNTFLTLIGRKDLVEKQYPKRRIDQYGNANQSVS